MCFEISCPAKYKKYINQNPDNLMRMFADGAKNLYEFLDNIIMAWNQIFFKRLENFKEEKHKIGNDAKTFFLTLRTLVSNPNEDYPLNRNQKIVVKTYFAM